MDLKYAVVVVYMCDYNTFLSKEKEAWFATNAVGNYRGVNF